MFSSVQVGNYENISSLTLTTVLFFLFIFLISINICFVVVVTSLLDLIIHVAFVVNLKKGVFEEEKKGVEAHF